MINLASFRALAFFQIFTSKDAAIRFAVHWLARFTEWLYKCQDVPVWRSADGRVTKITRMSDQHLENSIKLLQRNFDHPWCYQHLLLERNYRRGLGTYNPGDGYKRKRSRGIFDDFDAGRVPILFREVDFTELEREVVRMYERDRRSTP